MDNIEALRKNLVSYVQKKFYSRRNIADIADEIVNQAFADVMRYSSNRDDVLNFGYMSVACIRVAYKVFHRNDFDAVNTVSFELHSPLIDEDSFVDEIQKTEDTAVVIQSLQTLKRIEQIIITERYYGDFSFKEISQHHGININTILSHHYRALEKLRPVMSKYFPDYASTYYYGKGKEDKKGGNKND